MDKILATFKFYDKQGRRVAIFGIPTLTLGEYDNLENMESRPIDSIMIYVIPCSTKDQFSKKKAKELFHQVHTLVPPEGGKIPAHEGYAITVDKGEAPKGAFLKWVRQNYQEPTSHYKRIWEKVVRKGSKKWRVVEHNENYKIW